MLPVFQRLHTFHINHPPISCHRFDLGGDIFNSMINHPIVTAEEFTDTELVARSLAGDRDAFSRIVTRYQILICSLAYSRIGHLGQSEDVAQETFIIAWKRLRLLREPAKLRAWLCGIVNFRVQKTLRREGREPVHRAESLDEVLEASAAVALPSEETISREEEAILWRSLERIPEIYRQPLVLFYREDESVQAVAQQLDLTEDAVKQRLSRGRKLLQEEVQSFVEKSLRRTAPGQAFSSAVLSALPVAQAASVGITVAGKGAAMAKGGALAVLLATLAPILGIVLGVISQWFLIRATVPAGRVRRARTIELIAIWTCVIGVSWGGEAAMRTAGQHYAWSDRALFYALCAFWWLYIVGLVTWFMALFSRERAKRAQREAAGEVVRIAPGLRAGMAAGLHLAMFLWVITLAWHARDLTGVALTTVIMVALAVWNYFKLRGLAGMTAAAVNGEHYGLCGVAIVAILNFRMDVWMSGRYHVSVAEIHRMFPLWLVPVLSVALFAWIQTFRRMWVAQRA